MAILDAETPRQQILDEIRPESYRTEFLSFRDEEKPSASDYKFLMPNGIVEPLDMLLHRVVRAAEMVNSGANTVIDVMEKDLMTKGLGHAMEHLASALNRTKGNLALSIAPELVDYYGADELTADSKSCETTDGMIEFAISTDSILNIGLKALQGSLILETDTGDVEVPIVKPVMDLSMQVSGSHRFPLDKIGLSAET